MLTNYNAKTKSQKLWVILTIGLLISLLVSGCGGSTESKTYRIGLLSGVDSFDGAFDGFKAKMTELGYVEGENIVYDFQAASGDAEKMSEIAAQFVTDDVDMIVTTTNGGVLAAQEAIDGTDIPVVFCVAANVVKLGIAESIGHPGGNLTGIELASSTHYGKRLEFLTKMAPEAKRVWIMYQAEYPAIPPALAAVQEVASTYGLELIETQVNSGDEFSAEMKKRTELEDPGVDAFFIMPDPINITGTPTSIEFGKTHGLPIVAASIQSVELGGLYTYAFKPEQTGEAAAVIADKIFKGTNPSDLPIEIAELFLSVNLKAAQEIGIEIPDDILGSANDIIR